MTIPRVAAVLIGMESSDADIVRRVRAGDVGAFRDIVQRHYEPCLRYSMRMLGNRADAEEVVQDVFSRAYRYLASFEDWRCFRAWIMQLTVNEVRNAFARRRRHDNRLVSLDPSADFVSDTRVADIQIAADVQRALSRLDPKQREVIVLKYVDDLTYETMSEITGLPIPALKMRVKRAREHLEALLEGWKS